MKGNLYKEVEDIYREFPDDECCQNYLETLRWPEHVVSPFHPFSQVYQCKNNTYKCRKSGKYFNVRTGTLFHNSRIPLNKWFAAFWIIGKRGTSITSVALGKDLEITQKTAWYLLSRIKETGIESFGAIVSDTQEQPENFENSQLIDWLRTLKNL